MIVRILTDGQYRIDDAELGKLNELDEALVEAITKGDRPAFERDLRALVTRIRESGDEVPVDELLPSDVVVPAEDFTLETVRDLLGPEGLVPDELALNS